MELMSRNTKQLGEVMARLRNQKEMTQGGLGEKAGLRQATISGLENGEPGTRLQTLFDVLAALDLEVVIRPRSKGSAEDIEDIF